MSTLAFYAQFIASKIGVNGLTVTWDVERITRSDGTRSALVTGGATSITIGRRGLYGYLLTGADTLLYDYVATAITATTTVDQQEIAALWTIYEADVLKVSGDGDAADNLELFFDGTGYTSAGTINSVTGTVTADVVSLDGATEPLDNLVLSIESGGYIRADVARWAGSVVENYATAAQIDAIGSGTGAALNFAAVVDNTGGALKGVSFVGSQTLTYAATSAEDGSRHAIADSGGSPDIDIVYRFDIGAGRNAAKVIWKGTVSTGDTVTVQAYNGSTWDTRATISATGGTNVTRDIALLSTHTGTGADAGLVYIRFTATGQSNITLATDELLVAGVAVGLTTGYADGAVWVKATGNVGTTPYINGTADNPCPWANALTVAATVGLNRFRVVNDETITLSAGLSNTSVIGEHWYLALGGQAVTDCYVKGAIITGVASGTEHNIFEDCEVGTGVAGATIPPGNFLRCGFNTPSGQPFVGATAGNYVMVDCYSLVAGAGTPYFSFPGASGVNFRRYSGGSNITLTDPSARLTMEVVTGGGQTIATGGASCEVRGTCRSLTLVLSASETVQFAGVTGLIAISGAATAATVNLYGVIGVLTDTSTGSSINTFGISQTTIKTALEADGSKLDHLWEMTEDDSGVRRLTTNALEQAPSSGSGPTATVYTVTSGGLPVDGVYCRLTTDAAGLANVAAGTTNASGQVTFHHNLAAGTTVYIHRSKAGYTPVAPEPDIEVL